MAEAEKESKAMRINTEVQELEAFDYNSIAMNMVQFQVEYHFSDTNLALDNHLLSKLHQDKEYWVSLKTIANLSKIKAITEDIDIILKAIRKSEIIILNDDESKAKRRDFIPPKPKHHKNMRRTVFIYGLHDQTNEADIIEMCSIYGKLNAVIFDNGCKHIFDRQAIKKDDFDAIDREVAIAIMTKKFGPRAIRSNSSSSMSYQNVLSPVASPADLTPISAAASPVFVHPIPNQNGNPLDFSHLKTCFAIFQSQSQANNFVKSKGRTSQNAYDGIKAIHQYEYIKYQKKESMHRARGISSLISPNSINLALNSATYASIGSAKHSANISHSHSHSHSDIDDAAQMAMEFYLTNYQSGTPMLIVPPPIADAMAQTFTEKLASNPPHSQPIHYRHSAPHPHRHPHTWSHNGYANNGHFDFERRSHSNSHSNRNNKRFSNRNSSQPQSRSHYDGYHGYQYHGGSKSMTHRRNMSRNSWRNPANGGGGRRRGPKGVHPPAPSPHYFKANNRGGIGVASNVPHYVLKQRQQQTHSTHQSPAITPNIASISAP